MFQTGRFSTRGRPSASTTHASTTHACREGRLSRIVPRRLRPPPHRAGRRGSALKVTMMQTATSAIVLIVGAFASSATMAPSHWAAASTSPPVQIPAGISPNLHDVLERAAGASARYALSAAVTLADEWCEQRLHVDRVDGSWGLARGGLSPTTTLSSRPRRWRAEFALVNTPELESSGFPWVEFRDVQEVDGRSLPNRHARLERLFVDGHDWTMAKAAAIVEESTRFNMGPVARHFTTPGLALLMLHVTNQRRFEFGKIGEDQVDGCRAWKVSFQEHARPTLIRSGARGSEDAPASGTFWLEPETGEVLRSEVNSRTRQGKTRVSIAYGYHQGLGTRLPTEMRERASQSEGGVTVEARYTYANYRRFEMGARMIVAK
jgi:hypothetical protein